MSEQSNHSVDLSEVQNLLADLESYRLKYSNRSKRFKKIRKWYKWTFPILILAILVTLAFVVVLPITLPVIIALGVLAIIDIIISSRFAKREEAFYVRFKNEVLPLAVSHAGEGLKYSLESSITKDVLERSGLIDERMDKFHSEDVISGAFNNVSFKCAEVRMGKMALSGSKIAGNMASGCLSAILDIFFDMGDDVGVGDDADENRKYVPLFHGLFAIVDFHKSFNGTVLLRPRQDKIGSDTMRDYESVSIGDVAFEKKYEVFSSNQVVARYILSTYLIQQIDLLDDYCPRPLLASFQNGLMCIGLPQDKDLFEADFYKGVPDIQAFKDLVHEIKIIERLLEHLNQNTRIWGDKALD